MTQVKIASKTGINALNDQSFLQKRQVWDANIAYGATWPLEIDRNSNGGSSSATRDLDDNPCWRFYSGAAPTNWCTIMVQNLGAYYGLHFPSTDPSLEICFRLHSFTGLEIRPRIGFMDTTGVDGYVLARHSGGVGGFWYLQNYDGVGFSTIASTMPLTDDIVFLKISMDTTSSYLWGSTDGLSWTLLVSNSGNMPVATQPLTPYIRSENTASIMYLDIFKLRVGRNLL